MDGKKKKSRKMQIMRVYRNTIRKAGSMVWSFDRKFFLVNFFFVCIQGVIPAVRIFFLKEIVNFIQQNEKNINIILSYVIIYIFMDFCDEIIETLYLHYNAKFELEFSNHVNILMLKKAGKLQIKNFEDTETYDIISRAQAQSGNNILTFITSIEEMGKQIVRIISMALILINFRVWIVLIIMIVPICRNVIVIHIDQEWYKLRMKRTNEERKNRYINYLMMTGNAFKEILLHGLSDYLINKYKIRAEQIIEDDKVMQRKIVLLSLASDFIDGLITGSIFLYVINLAINNFILIGSVTAYLECIENIKLGMQEIFDGIGNSIEQSLYINFIFDFFEMPENTNTGNIGLEYIDSIRVENLSFKYRNKYVLKNVNLTINKGDSIVLIGENGSGKSTLIKLIMGFYSDYEGTIKINGIDLKNINKENYYKKIGCVFQDYTKYEASVRENVGFGDVGRINDSEKIKESLNTSFMLKKIEEIGGLDTIVGKWFGDKDFSTGEWQRIAISRAFFKDADVYIFDEADASLDILKQEKLFEIYNRRIQNKTKIYITHKIDYAKRLATKFYMLEDGCIVESGTHESLIEEQGRYYSMYNVYNSMKERRN